MNEKPRFVFDSNVLVSAAIFPQSQPGVALTAGLRAGAILLSSATVQELKLVLARSKFDRYFSIDTRNRFVAALMREATLLEPEESIDACRDAKDKRFLELAVEGQATCLISGDADLLVLDPFRGIRIVAPADFAKMAWDAPT